MVKVDDHLLNELLQAFNEVGGWGSVEIYIQDGRITQITRRSIKKTDHKLSVANPS